MKYKHERRVNGRGREIKRINFADKKRVKLILKLFIILHILWVGGRNSALPRKALRESFLIDAIIINHILLLNPSQHFLVAGIKRLRHPWRRVLAAPRRCIGPHASIGIVASEGSREWGLGPVRFHHPSSCRPILRIP